MSVKFNTTKAESLLIEKIVERTHAELVRSDPHFDKLSLEMDITAVHCNDVRLDLKKLLAFDKFNFAHDIGGICNTIDRTTGKLTKHFLPRCSEPEKVAA